jgi:hypothetical protein
MEEDKLIYALQLWDQAGERPYEVLIKENLYDSFLEHIKNMEIDHDGFLYRGTRRHSELNIGDKFVYNYPTSWSTNYDNASNFVEQKQVIIKLNVNANKVFGIYNDQNSYGEKEYILCKFETTIKNKYGDGNFIILEI